MNNENMKKALAKVGPLVTRICEEHEHEHEILRDMADSFIQQAKEDEDKKLKFSINLKAVLTPVDGDDFHVEISESRAIKKTDTIECLASEDDFATTVEEV